MANPETTENTLDHGEQYRREQERRTLVIPLAQQIFLTELQAEKYLGCLYPNNERQFWGMVKEKVRAVVGEHLSVDDSDIQDAFDLLEMDGMVEIFEGIRPRIEITQAGRDLVASWGK